MIKKVWAKFKEEDIVCICNHENKKCDKAINCEEYIVKFTTIERDNYNKEFYKHRLMNKHKKLVTELNKTTRHIKNMSTYTKWNK